MIFIFNGHSYISISLSSIVALLTCLFRSCQSSLFLCTLCYCLRGWERVENNHLIQSLQSGFVDLHQSTWLEILQVSRDFSGKGVFSGLVCVISWSRIACFYSGFPPSFCPWYVSLSGATWGIFCSQLPPTWFSCPSTFRFTQNTAIPPKSQHTGLCSTLLFPREESRVGSFLLLTRRVPGEGL